MERDPFGTGIIAFGRVPIGDRVRAPIYVQNTTDVAWSFLPLAFEDETFAFTSTAPETVEAFDENLAVTVDAQPSGLRAFTATASVQFERGERAPVTITLTLAGTGVARTFCGSCNAALGAPVCEELTTLTSKTGTCAEDLCLYDRAVYPCAGEACCEGICPPRIEVEPHSMQGTRGQSVTLRMKILNCEGVPFSGATIRATVDGDGAIAPELGRSDQNGVVQFQATLRNRLGIDTFRFTLLGWPGEPSTTARITVLE